jgi:type VI secretion system protein ImpG
MQLQKLKDGGSYLAKNSFHLELSKLRELAAGFAEANPALAPLLNSSMPDPDVERLLDAVAHQNNLLDRKLGVDFPELVQKLANFMLPHYLRPIPATTIVTFTPQPSLGRTIKILAGSQIASTPVDGTLCQFTTSCDLEVQPVELLDIVSMQISVRAAEIRMKFALQSLSLSQWQPGRLRFFLSGDRAAATELYALFCQNITGIVVSTADGGACVTLPPGHLKPSGFDENEALIPYPAHAFPGYRLLQEYFNAPEKFLFFELTGLERWEQRGDGCQFSVSFQFDGLSSGLPRIGPSSFVLNAVPAINIFSHEADPVRIDHRASRYQVRPSGPGSSGYQILSIDCVTGYSRETGKERKYAAFELFSSDSLGMPTYHSSLEKSTVRPGYDVFLSVAFPAGSYFPTAETLSIGLTCTNGTLPEKLRIGDICYPVFGISEEVTVRNITPVHPGFPPPLGSELLWRLTCHLYLNHMSLASARNLSTLLTLYAYREDSSGTMVTANLKRIDGIEEVSVVPSEFLVSGVMLMGSEIRLKVRQDCFASAGDLYLFGCILDRFLAKYSSINYFTRLIIKELLRGECTLWPMRQE